MRLPPELTVGFEEIDGQHRLLLRRVEACVAAVDGNREGLAAALSALGDYLMAHFSAEESFMEESGYPDRGKHKAAHDLFMQDFGQLTQEVETLGVTPLARHWVASRVPEWTRFHIQVNDVPLGRYLSSRRFRPEAAAAREKPRAS